MLPISRLVAIPADEIELQPIRAQGGGGQNVNKVSTAIHLRFDIHASSLPEAYKTALLLLNDQRISSDGVIVIKAQQYRSQEQNREDALQRLQSLIQAAVAPRKKRKATKPSKGAQQRRLDSKDKRGRTKALRSKVDL